MDTSERIKGFYFYAHDRLNRNPATNLLGAVQLGKEYVVEALQPAV